jgi:hypothetical protein
MACPWHPAVAGSDIEDETEEAMHSAALAVTVDRDRASVPSQGSSPSAELADEVTLAELEQACELLTELLDPYVGPLDACEWHVVSAARQVIWRLAREARRGEL